MGEHDNEPRWTDPFLPIHGLFGMTVPFRCRLFGHKYGPPIFIGVHRLSGDEWFEYRCKRCPAYERGRRSAK